MSLTQPYDQPYPIWNWNGDIWVEEKPFALFNPRSYTPKMTSLHLKTSKEVKRCTAIWLQVFKLGYNHEIQTMKVAKKHYLFLNYRIHSELLFIYFVCFYILLILELVTIA